VRLARAHRLAGSAAVVGAGCAAGRRIGPAWWPRAADQRRQREQCGGAALSATVAVRQHFTACRAEKAQWSWQWGPASPRARRPPAARLHLGALRGPSAACVAAGSACLSACKPAEKPPTAAPHRQHRPAPRRPRAPAAVVAGAVLSAQGCATPSAVVTGAAAPNAAAARPPARARPPCAWRRTTARAYQLPAPAAAAGSAAPLRCTFASPLSHSPVRQACLCWSPSARWST
jgi:hypothetical protein